jgi:hypothetical protein
MVPKTASGNPALPRDGMQHGHTDRIGKTGMITKTASTLPALSHSCGQHRQWSEEG